MSNEVFLVKGNAKLSGEITPQGAKNEALQIISAVLLTKEKVTVSNIPDILDVRRLIALLKGLGVAVKRINKNKYSFQAKDINLKYFSSKEYLAEAKKIRGSVMLMGPLLTRFGRAYLPKPGGDKIGRRRLDTHFHGFIALGAKFKYKEKNDEFFLEGKALKGCYLHMEEISVTGTANVVMAAVLAKGTTTVYLSLIHI